MADDSLHLRMVGIPGNQNPLGFPGIRRYNPMDLGHKRTGGVQYLHPALHQRIVHSLAHTVGADDNGIPRHRLLRLMDGIYPQLQKLLYHLRIVNDGAEGANPLSLLHRRKHHIHRPAHTKAEPSAFGNGHHMAFPSQNPTETGVLTILIIISDFFGLSSGKISLFKTEF